MIVFDVDMASAANVDIEPTPVAATPIVLDVVSPVTIDAPPVAAVDPTTEAVAVTINITLPTITKEAEPSFAAEGVLAANAWEEWRRATSLGGTGSLSGLAHESYPRPVLLSGSGTLSGVASVGGYAVSPQFYTEGILTALIRSGYTQAAELSMLGALAASASKTQDSATPQLSGTGTLVGTAGVGMAGQLSTTGALAATLREGYTRATSLSGVCSLSGAAGVRKDSVTTQLSAAGTVTATLREGYTRAAALSGTGSLTATASGGQGVAAPLGMTGALTATVDVTKDSVTPSLSGAGTLTAPQVGVGMAATLSAIGALAASMGVGEPANLSASGTISATLTEGYTRTASPSCTGNLSAVCGVTKDSINPFLSGAGVLSAVLAEGYTRIAALSATGSLSAVATTGSQRDASLDMTGTLTGAGAVTKDSVTAALATAGSVTATVGVGVDTFLTTVGALSAEAGITSDTRSAALSTAGTLSAAAYVGVIGNLTGAGTLTATAVKTSDSAAASVSATGSLSAAVTEGYTRPSALSAAGTLSATAVKTSDSAEAALAATGTLTATKTEGYTRISAPSMAGTLSAAVGLGEPATLSATGTLTATATKTKDSAAATLTGTGTLSGMLRESYSRAASPAMTGTISATAVKTSDSAAAALSGTGTLTATKTEGYTRTSAPAMTGTLTAAVYSPQRAAALSATGTLTATATGSGGNSFNLFLDNFNAGIGASWVKVGNTANVNASSGAVRIDHPTTSEYNNLETVAAYDLTGNAAFVQIVDYGNMSLASHDVIFQLSFLSDYTNHLRWHAEGTTLEAHHKVNNIDAQIGVTLTLDTAVHKWLRIRESAGSIYWDTSVDGSTWTNRFSELNPIAVTALKAILQCGNWQTEASASYAIFDNFNTPACRPALSAIGTLSATAVAQPTFTAVNPTPYVVSGQYVTLIGGNFVAGATVDFGGNAGTNVTIVNASTITCQVPSHANGAVNCTITSSGITTGAISVTYQSIAVVSAVAAAVSTDTPAVTFPATYIPTTNDLVVLWPSSTTTATVNTVSGYTNPLGAGIDVESDAHEISIVYHLVTATEQTNTTRTYTITSAGPTNWYGNSETGDVSACIIRGNNTTTVVDDINSWNDTGNSTTPHVLAGLTGANLGTGSLVLSAVAKDGAGSYTTPSGWTQLVSDNNNQGKWLGMRNTLTTATTDVTATNITPNAGDEGASITIAILPA